MTIRTIDTNSVNPEASLHLRVLPEIPTDAARKLVVASATTAALLTTIQAPVSAATNPETTEVIVEDESLETAIANVTQPSMQEIQTDSSAITNVAIAESQNKDAKIEEAVVLTYIVQPNDTVSEILADNSATLISEISDIDHIVPEQEINLQLDNAYSVATADSTRKADIEQLAEIHDITVDTIKWANDPDGDRIIVPVHVEEYTIEPGDTLSELSDEAMSIDGLAHINDINDPNLIVEGETIIVPAKAIEAETDPVTVRTLTLRKDTTLSDIAAALVQVDVYAADFDEDLPALAEELRIDNEIEDETRIPAGTPIHIGPLNDSEFSSITDTYTEVADERAGTSLQVEDAPVQPDTEIVTVPLEETITPVEVFPNDLPPTNSTTPPVDTPPTNDTQPDVDILVETADLYTTYKLEDFSSEYQEIVATIPDIHDAVELYDFWRTGSFGPQITAEDVVRKNINAGWTGEDLVTVVALELGAESNRSPFVVNTWAEKDDRFALGTFAVGGLQVLGNVYGDYKGEGQSWLADPIRDPQSNLDPMFNAHAAFAIYEESGGSFRPWEAFTEDMHWQYMDEARVHIDNVLSGRSAQEEVIPVNPPETETNVDSDREPAALVETGEVVINPTFDHPLIDSTTLRPEDGMVVDGELSSIMVVDIEGMSVNADIALNVANMLTAARADGHDLTIGSAHRPVWRQEELRIDNGCPDINTSPASTCGVPTARPGYSRHQSGLALDLGLDGSAICFPNSRSWCVENGTPQQKAAIKWLDDNGGDYGLLSLASEAWHWSTDGR